jgi:cysteamine dioxygenase
VLFFIKKGIRMPIHDHPNMAVFFKLMFGNLSYRSFDKVEDKYKYNMFSNDEYEEMLAKKRTIQAKRSRKMNIKEGDVLVVRPSASNMHQFVATEDSCFFDICLPNYTPVDASRRITFFEEEHEDPMALQGGLTDLVWNASPPVMPIGFEVTDAEFRGDI